MVHTDAFGARELEFSKGGSEEARPVGGDPRSFASYRAPWFASVAWGALLCAAYPLLIMTPLAVFAVASPNSKHALIVEIGVDCASLHSPFSPCSS